MAIYKTKGPTEYLFSPWVEITQCKYIIIGSLHIVVVITIIIQGLKLCAYDTLCSAIRSKCLALQHLQHICLMS